MRRTPTRNWSIGSTVRDTGSLATFWLILCGTQTDGYRADHYRAEAWRYRDYVIRSFNTDKPYDQFIREQLAGDEIDPSNRDALVATMYFRHGIYEHNQRDVETQWAEILADVTNVTGDALLGLGCARCHDHKFDPITQRDYYRLQAFLHRCFNAHPCRLARWSNGRYSMKNRLPGPRQPRRFANEQPALLKQTTGEGFDKFIDKIKAMIRKRPVKRTAYERQIAELSERQFGVEPAKLAGETKAEWKRLRDELKQFDALKPTRR